MKDLTSWVNRCTLNVRAYTVKKEISNAAYAEESEADKILWILSWKLALRPISLNSNAAYAAESEVAKPCRPAFESIRRTALP